jgi:ketosteroid isomerase-like protein
METVMNAIENKKMVQHIFDEMANSNSDPLLESLADDFRFVVMGSSRWSRSYEGKATVLAEGDHVVVEARGRNTTRQGLAYNNTYCHVLRLEGGQLKEWVEYSDTALIDAVLGDPAEAVAAR